MKEEKKWDASHPRPDFRRGDFISLNGEWDFSFDIPAFDKKIKVPFCYQSRESGIGEVTQHPVVWYRRRFGIGEVGTDKSLLLKFGAVDYEAVVYVNGLYACGHKGGHTPFEADITELVNVGENTITVKVTDYNDQDKPRGKQSWIGEEFGCWYTATTGIWQSVWLEYAGRNYIRRIKITPEFARNMALLEVFASAMEKLEVDLSLKSLPADGSDGLDLGRQHFSCENGYGKCLVTFPDFDLRCDQLAWTPETPNLIEVEAVLEHDVVTTYFGMRSIGFQNGTFMINGNACYQRLILDQGYWTDTLLTPPDEESIKRDILLAKEMGFNGARKHQKIEDPRYYYWADKLGFFVWGELPSCYRFTDNTVENSSRELMEFVERDYNHPSVITWVTGNESWGIRNVKTETQLQDFSNLLIYTAKALDKTRPVSGNDGWEQTEQTDIMALHDYGLMPETIWKYDDMRGVIGGVAENRWILADGQEYKGQPVMMTEYGGIAFCGDGSGWGYYGRVKSQEEFLARLEPVTDFLIKSGKFSGFCYTQLTDVFQEVNGLLRADRSPKLPLEQLRSIFGKKVFEV